VHDSRSRYRIASFVGALVALPALAFAQHPDVECKKSETQSECHHRLKCKADEELEDCQKRLRKQTPASTDGQKQREPDQGGDRDNGDRNRNARRGNDGGDRDNGGDRGDRDDRGDRGDRNDRVRRGRDRGDRDDGGRHRDRSAARREGHGGFEANKTFGLGLEVGEPTSINGKVFVSRRSAIDFGIGYIYDDYYYGNGFHIYADYLWHPVSLASTQSFELPFYFGAGLRYWDFTYCDMNVCGFGGNAVGIRVPIGIAFDFNNVPLDVFIQLVPVLDFVGGNYYTRYGDRTHLGLDGSVGIRYWFK
jgi:hypothetical protein